MSAQVRTHKWIKHFILSQDLPVRKAVITYHKPVLDVNERSPLRNGEIKEKVV